MSVPGPVALMIGSCARVIGDFDRAAREFRESLRIAERVQGPYWIAVTKLLWSQLLLEQGGQRERERAGEMLPAVIDAAVRHGFAQLERRAREYLAELA